MIASSVTNGSLSVVLGAGVLALVFGVGLWALRAHDRRFPEGFDRTGWGPAAAAAG